MTVPVHQLSMPRARREGVGHRLLRPADPSSL